jgi:hypothetical protein
MKKTLLALKRWVDGAPEWADVAAMLVQIGNDEPEVQPDIVGAVYLLRHGRSYKIGCSRMVENRIRELQQMLPDRAKLVHAIATDDPHGVEAYWHRRFAAKRYRGEWFRLTPADIAAFRQRRFQ